MGYLGLILGALAVILVSARWHELVILISTLMLLQRSWGSRGDGAKAQVLVRVSRRDQELEESSEGDRNGHPLSWYRSQSSSSLLQVDASIWYIFLSPLSSLKIFNTHIVSLRSTKFYVLLLLHPLLVCIWCCAPRTNISALGWNDSEDLHHWCRARQTNSIKQFWFLHQDQTKRIHHGALGQGGIGSDAGVRVG